MKIEITDTAYGGYGVGRMTDGRVAMIPFTVEGDIVSVKITEDKKNFVFAETTEVINPSPKRGGDYCPHIGTCGGCPFGHIKHSEQIIIKEKIVKKVISRAGFDLNSVETEQSAPLRYRVRGTFRFRDGKAGFFGFKTRDFVPVEDCPVMIGMLSDTAQKFAAENPDEKGTLYLISNGEDILGTTTVTAAEQSRALFSGLKDGSGVYGQESIKLSTEYGDMKCGFDTFMQANLFLRDAFQKYACEKAEGKTLELYCGAGFFTLGLNGIADNVTAIEFPGEAIKLGESLGLENTRFVPADVNNFCQKHKKQADTVFVDPPRGGLGKPVISYLEKFAPKKIVYVSCAPDTLGRDLKKLNKNYRLESVKIFDMYPGSYHVETVSVLVRI